MMPFTSDERGERGKRKRNLLVISGILVLLSVATVFSVGVRRSRSRRTCSCWPC